MGESKGNWFQFLVRPKAAAAEESIRNSVVQPLPGLFICKNQLADQVCHSTSNRLLFAPPRLPPAGTPVGSPCSRWFRRAGPQSSSPGYSHQTYGTEVAVIETLPPLVGKSPDSGMRYSQTTFRAASISKISPGEPALTSVLPLGRRWALTDRRNKVSPGTVAIAPIPGWVE